MNVAEIRRPADMERINTPELAQAFIDEQIALILSLIHISEPTRP